MGIYKYSVKFQNEKSGCSQGMDLDASYKDLSNVCSAIKGKTVASARILLEEAITGKKPIPYKKFSKGVGHRSQLGGKKGRFPKKECRLVLQLLKNAESNADYKGLDNEALVVKHAAAFKQNVFPRHRKFWVGGNTLGYGKHAVRSDYVTARLELVLAESGKARKEKKATPKEKIGKATKEGKNGKTSGDLKKGKSEKEEKNNENDLKKKPAAGEESKKDNEEKNTKNEKGAEEGKNTPVDKNFEKEKVAEEEKNNKEGTGLKSEKPALPREFNAP